MGLDLIKTLDLDEELLPVWMEARIADEDDLLSDSRITKSFTPDQLTAVRLHRSQLLASLSYYRRALDIPRPKLAHRAVRSPTMSPQTITVASMTTKLIFAKGPGVGTAVAIGGVATWGLGAGGAETGVAAGAGTAAGVATLATPVVVVAAVVLLVHIAINADKVADMYRIYALGLAHAAEPLLADLLALQRAAIVVMMAAATLTAEEIARLTPEQIASLTLDLVKKYLKILLDATSKATVVNELLKRLIKEVPGCTAAIQDLIAARAKAFRFRAPSDLRTQINVDSTKFDDLKKAVEVVKQCAGL